VSWQLGAFAVLAAALATGAAWYEHSRPDARTVALVATLAAFAALGRVAFAALPNVKPSTDIVLVSGYALGAAPGFMVGAVCGLASNVFFGQGPWTPWQMAAWGLIGAAGAGLAVITRGRIGRVALAAVCGVAGLLFTALQDVGDWVNFSDHSAAQLGVYVGKGLGFDAVHAIGCVAFALLFGPALLRSLQRLNERLHVRWLEAGGAIVPLLLLAIAIGALVLPARAAASDTSGPVAYLTAAENSDGGFGGAPHTASQPLFAGWAALGLAAAGVDPATARHGGSSLLDYLAANAGLSDPGSIERTILAARAAGANPAAFGGHDLLAALRRRFAADGAVSDQVNLTVFAVLALRSAGVPASARTVSWIERQQNGDGGFGFASGAGASDPDDTGAALEALAASGAPAGVEARAVAYLRRAQNPDGGLPAQDGGASDAQSTAWAVQGLIAAGVDPDGVHRGGSPSPLAYIRGLEAPDGHIRYARGEDQTPVWVTAEALMALARRPLPLAPVHATPAPRRTIPAARRASSHTAAAASSATRTATTAASGAGAATASPPLRHTAAGTVFTLRSAARELSLGALAQEDTRAIMSALERLLAPVGLAVPQAA
jgi:energy-coupling factor transport system substrate-specific component